MRTWTLIGCLAAAVALCLFVVSRTSDTAQRMKDLQLAVGYGMLVIVFFLGFVILVDLVTGKINLSLLLAEDGGGASMSRFQLLVFTFVIGLSLAYIVFAKGDFPTTIPNQVLTLLGISATTYGVSKGIQAGGGLYGKGGHRGGGDGQGGGNDGAGEHGGGDAEHHG